MANKHKGEAIYELKDGTKLPLVLGLNTLAELEDRYEIKSINEIGQIFNNMTSRKLLFLFYLLINDGGTEMTEKEVGRIPIEVEKLNEAVGQAIILAFPKDKQSEAKKQLKK